MTGQDRVDLVHKNQRMVLFFFLFCELIRSWSPCEVQFFLYVHDSNNVAKKMFNTIINNATIIYY